MFRETKRGANGSTVNIQNVMLAHRQFTSNTMECAGMFVVVAEYLVFVVAGTQL